MKNSMHLEFEFNDKDKSKIKKTFFLEIFKKTLVLSKMDFLAQKNVSLSVAIISEEEMQLLNKTYRQKNAVTDVLSFAEYGNQKKLREAGDKNVFLGEIILCYNDIVKFSQKNKKNLQTELTETISHGLLHLLGFRHGKKMFAIQKAVSIKFSLSL
jgi:probable rRNA maturation factor